MRLMIATIGLAFALAPATYAADEASSNEYRLDVDGMVCSMCTYGVEQALQHTAGVLDAIADLENQTVVAKVSDTQTPTASTIVGKILDQHFSVGSIAATLTGTLERTDKELVFVVGGEKLPLIEPETESLELSRYVGQALRLEGEFQGIDGVDNAEGRPRFVVHRIAGD